MKINYLKFMSICIGILFLILPPVFGAVIIDEVLYDPINDENGGEAILLYNDGETKINLSDWTLATKTSFSDVTLPLGSYILPKGYLLIADSGFSIDKDDPSWPDADFEEAMGLGNTDAYVALINNNTIIDTVAWGSATNINDSFYESNPALEIAPGKSLKRTNHTDTNNNLADFSEATAFAGFIGGTAIESANFAEAQIIVTANVLDNNPEILNFQILIDESENPGIQINPISNSKKTVEVLVEVTDKDSLDEINKTSVIFNSKEFLLIEDSRNSSSIIFKGTFDIDYFIETNNYSITSRVYDYESDEIEIFIGFELLPLASLKVDSTLEFNIIPGQTSTKTISVKNTGNVDLDLVVKASDLIGDSLINKENISISNIKLSDKYKQINQILPTGENSTYEIEFLISPNSNIAKDSYQGNIWIGGLAT